VLVVPGIVKIYPILHAMGVGFDKVAPALHKDYPVPHGSQVPSVHWKYPSIQVVHPPFPFPVPHPAKAVHVVVFVNT